VESEVQVVDHWHRCQRWTRLGLPCPFSGLATDTEEAPPSGEGPSELPKLVPQPPVIVGRKVREKEAKPGIDEKGLEGVLREIRGRVKPPVQAEPFKPSGLPPVKPPVGPSPVPQRAPAPSPARVPVRVQSAMRAAVQHGFRVAVRQPVRPGFRVAKGGREKARALRAARIAELATANEVAARVKPKRRARRGAIAAGIAGAAAAGGIIATRYRGGRGGFFFNQARRMRALAGAGPLRRTGQAEL